MFDLTVLKMQLGLASQNELPDKLRFSIVEIAGLLEDKDAIPAVKDQLESCRPCSNPSFGKKSR